MSTLHYRYAGLPDQQLLAQLYRQLIEEHADTGEAELPRLLRRVRQWLSRGYRAVLFESAAGETLAYALFREHHREIYLRQFLVLPQARRHGVGRQAMDLLRGRIWPAGKRLTVEVMTSNPDGYRFWHAMGYRDCAVTLEIPGLGNGDSGIAHAGKVLAVANPDSRVPIPAR